SRSCRNEASLSMSVRKAFSASAAPASLNATTTLGPSGGYRLAKHPSDINFIEIVEAVEGKARSFNCTNIRANNPCRPEGYCDSKPCAVARIMWE
ncbi:Rrf2 family transcriptional regulator, partial [Rhizobium ruizarguesonis]